MEKCTRPVAVPSREPDDFVARIAKLEHLAQSAQELQQIQTATENLASSHNHDPQHNTPHKAQATNDADMKLDVFRWF